MGPIGRAFSDLAAQLAALAGTRLELFGLEARDAGDRLLCRLAALLAAAIFLLLALLVATLALALMFWPTEYRFLALGLLAGAGALWGTRAFLRSRRWFDFRDRVVVVTGADSGLGLILCEHLADHGAIVVMAARKGEVL